jgi:aldose 1-epimerase
MRSGSEIHEVASNAEHVVLSHPDGLRVGLTNYGASICSIEVPTDSGFKNVVLGHSSVESYPKDQNFLGATLGRYSGRIDRGRLALGDKILQLATSATDDGHTLHGGPEGLYSRLWDIDANPEQQSVKFSYLSPHGEQGFPGNLRANVTYSLTHAFELNIHYSATCDQDTVINLANHAYFNLNGDGGRIDDHLISINADRYTPLQEDLIPTGELSNVCGTPFDLRKPALLAVRLRDLADNSRSLHGFDHNFVLHKPRGEFGRAARVEAPASGISLDVYTTQPGLQLYTGDKLTEPFVSRGGLCLEAQNFPDAPNHPDFPTALLRRGESYSQRTLYVFGREKNCG